MQHMMPNTQLNNDALTGALAKYLAAFRSRKGLYLGLGFDERALAR